MADPSPKILPAKKGARKGEWFGPLGELVESMLRSE